MEEAVEFLLDTDDSDTPGCLYGSKASDCAPVAYVLALVLVEHDPEAVMGEELLDYCMGLVVNSHGDVAGLLSDYARTVGWNFDADNYDIHPIEENDD
jgi:hypothetical protein